MSSDGDLGPDGDPVVALSAASESVAVAGGVVISATVAIVDRLRPGCADGAGEGEGAALRRRASASKVSLAAAMICSFPSRLIAIAFCFFAGVSFMLEDESPLLLLLAAVASSVSRDRFFDSVDRSAGGALLIVVSINPSCDSVEVPTAGSGVIVAAVEA